MKIKTVYLLLLTIFSLQWDAQAKNNKREKQLLRYTAIIDSCHDGDTCRATLVQNLLRKPTSIQTKKIKSDGSQIIKIRFAGIDAPELKQNEGKLAKNFTESLILKKEVELECEGKSFDRTTCTVFLEKKNINEEIVRNGYAWDSPKYSMGKYQPLMLAAQKQKLGIWKTTTVSPYCFRHKNNKKCATNKLTME